MNFKNIFLLITLLFSIESFSQVVNSTELVDIGTDDEISGWVEVEILDGCLDIESDGTDTSGMPTQNFRISLTDEQINLNDDFRLEISDGTYVLLAGNLSTLIPSTPPIVFSNISLGIYTVTLYNANNTYECKMKISFKEVD